MDTTGLAIVLPEKLTELRTPKESPTGRLRAIMKVSSADPTTWLEQEEDMYIQAVMQSGWLSSTGVDIPPEATDADVAILIRASSGLHKTDAWLRGDTALWVRNHKFNGQIPAAELESLSKLFGCSGKRILNSATTSAAFPRDKRDKHVPFSIYEIAAKIEDQASRDYMVEQAAVNEWSVRTMTEKVEEWLATQSKVDEDGNVITPGEVVLNADGSSVVVRGNVTVSQTGGAQVNVSACIAEIVRYALERGMDKSCTGVVAETLIAFSEAGMIRFPVKAWLTYESAQ